MAGPPTNEEYGLLVLVNESRAEPSADGGTEPVLPPYVWSDDLAAAARYHSDDMAAHPGCFQHNSCGGGSWSARIGQYYPGWTNLGENIGSGNTDPRYLHAGWMASGGHRANILSGSFAEFGAGIAIGHDGFGSLPLATEDFGRRTLISLQSIPAIPAATVLPRLGDSETRDLLVNYYHYQGGSPRAVRALYGSQCINLSRRHGSANHGTYAAARSLSGGGCVPLVFEAIRSDGVRARFPSSGAILVGVGGASCAERTTSTPSATCGDPPPPSPTPTPSPTPVPGGGADGLSKAQALLRPANDGTGKGQIRLAAVLEAPAGFDPSRTSVRLTLTFSSGSRWIESLPMLCDGEPCLVANKKRTTFRARYGKGGPSLSFALKKSGDWQVRYASRASAMSGIVEGPATLKIEADGGSPTISLTGEWRGNRFFVH